MLTLATSSVEFETSVKSAAGTVEIAVSMAKDPAAGKLTLTTITSNLAAALQSNQLFLVASDPTTLATGQPAGNGAVLVSVT